MRNKSVSILYNSQNKDRQLHKFYIERGRWGKKKKNNPRAGKMWCQQKLTQFEQHRGKASRLPAVLELAVVSDGQSGGQ